ncbi:hypothetical protein [Nostoc sp.]|uniref:hypothetical protein n=1 Tax=Nostoc sp. TaxID=1180 RepID=UPI002FF89C1D
MSTVSNFTDKYPEATFPDINRNGQTAIPAIPKPKAAGTTFVVTATLRNYLTLTTFATLRQRLDSFDSHLGRKLVESDFFQSELRFGQSNSKVAAACCWEKLQ